MSYVRVLASRLGGEASRTQITPISGLELAVARRFASKIERQPDGCWRWTDALTPAGYGRLLANGKTLLAHRISYELLNGPIPLGFEIDHLCRNRACVNPDHLEAVAHRDNMRRAIWPTYSGPDAIGSA